MEPNRERLINAIVDSLGWGPVAGWPGKNFVRLNQAILHKTGVNLSESTLRRVLGKVNYPHLPAETTLDALAAYIGYTDWQTFKQAAPVITPTVVQVLPPATRRRLPRPLLLAAAFVTLLFVTCWMLAYKPFTHVAESNMLQASFTSRPLTHTIPNTVVFDYSVDSTVSPLYIQQSWDPATKTAVSAKRHTATSIYYKPGFYQAKLVAGNQVIKQHNLLVPTNGWLGLINQSPEPFYLHTNEFVHADRLEISATSYTSRGLHNSPIQRLAEMYNVGSFRALKAADASFTAMVKSSVISNEGGCGTALVFLITNGVPYRLPITAKGCVATAYLYDGHSLVDGKVNDLSGFGANLSEWVKFSMHANAGKMQFFIDDKLAYQAPLPAPGLEIVGIAFGFNGGGEVKNIRLADSKGTAFSEF